MNGLKSLIESIVQSELKTLLEKRRVKPTIMFHGTSSKFLPKIFQLGMIPEPTTGKWKDEKLEQQTDLLNPSLRSLKGSYWTDNVGVALSSANNTRKEVGGVGAIVIAQIIQQSGLSDEDDIRGPINQAFGKVVSEYFGAAGTTENAWRIKGLIDANPTIYQKIIDDFAEKLHNSLTKNPKMPIDKPQMKRAFDTFLERMLAHMPIEEGWYNKSRYFESYQVGLEKSGMDYKKAHEKTREDLEKSLPAFNKVSAEKAFLDSLEELSARYRASALPPKSEEEYRYRTNIRITQPVGFSGRNKIIGIVVMNDDRNLENVYGTVPVEFINGYKRFWGPKFKLIDKKSGQVVYNGI